MTKDELAKFEKPGPLVVPDFLKDVAGHEGLESMRPQDHVLPRISLAQSTTPQVKRMNVSFISELRDGLFFNNVTEQVYGEELVIIPLRFDQSRIYFREMDEGGGILCQSLNGIDGGTLSQTCESCAKSKFTSGEEGKRTPPECTDYLNVLALLLPNLEPGLISFKSTALKPARLWREKVYGRNKPSYCQVWIMKSVPEKRAGQDYFGPQFSVRSKEAGGPWVTEAQYKEALKLFRQLQGKVVQAAEDHEVAAKEPTEEDIPF